ncbi:MAG: type II toxin-antitoxin system HicB family antitoxin [Candidatus Poribacteria bacterium]|nr:type II toxin-antitoxin system HicB family antitoxin [Candidatus Poribacteria bacterium]
MEYLVVLEKSDSGFGAYLPDLPGCIAVAETLEETKELITEAVNLHIDRMREMGLPVASCSSLRFVFEMEPNMDEVDTQVI